MDAELQALNDKFNYNIMLSKSMLPFLQANDRYAIKEWIEKLGDMNKNVEMAKTRNEYIWFILLMLQNNKILSLFKNLPPAELVPLKVAVPQALIDELLLSHEQNMSWLEKINQDHKFDEDRRKKIAPAKFLENQPLPKEGVTCYISAFSDHN